MCQSSSGKAKAKFHSRTRITNLFELTRNAIVPHKLTQGASLVHSKAKQFLTHF